MKPWIKFGLSVVFLIIVIAAATLEPVDRRPLVESKHYQKMSRRIDSLSQLTHDFQGDTLEVGWAKLSLVPPFKTSLAGYGAGNFEEIVDTLFTRSFVFDNGSQSVALVTPDLLIFPPKVRRVVEIKLQETGIDGVYYSATHTHHSVGNWHPGFVGKMFGGNFREEVVEWLGDQIVISVKEAMEQREKSRIGFAAIQAEHLVYNRLVGDEGTTDPWLRFLTIEQTSGKKAVLASFSAHPTNISRQELITHRDYPGFLVDHLEEADEIDFAAFLGGAMGSHGSDGPGTGKEKAEQMASDLSYQVRLIQNVVTPKYLTSLGLIDMKLELGEPQFRVTPHLRIRRWLFDQLFGGYAARLTFLRLGDTILVGTPCDFSGELVGPIESMLREEDFNLILTSFNGSYIGYITADQWYDLNRYETRTMNWFGPHNGKYFTEIISRTFNTIKD